MRVNMDTMGYTTKADDFFVVKDIDIQRKSYTGTMPCIRLTCV